MGRDFDLGRVSTKTPIIGTNGNWYLWDSALGAYVDSGVSARPDDSLYVRKTGTNYTFTDDTGLNATMFPFSVGGMSGEELNYDKHYGNESLDLGVANFVGTEPIIKIDGNNSNIDINADTVQKNGEEIATETWVNNKGFLTAIPDASVTVDSLAQILANAIIIRDTEAGASYPDGAGFVDDDFVVSIPASSNATGITVKRCGVNVFEEETELGAITGTGEEASSSSRLRTKGYTLIRPNTTYYYLTSSPDSDFICFYDKDKTFISGIYRRNATFTTPANAVYLRIGFSGQYGSVYKNDVAINYPAAENTYSAYDGTINEIDFGQTVDEGSFDFTTGVLTIVSPTPGTAQLTPIPTTSKVGQNNIVSNIGTPSVTYIANTKLYIDKVS